jgi:hypothetical protein
MKTALLAVWLLVGVCVLMAMPPILGQLYKLPHGCSQPAKLL